MRTRLIAIIPCLLLIACTSQEAAPDQEPASTGPAASSDDASAPAATGTQEPATETASTGTQASTAQAATEDTTQQELPRYEREPGDISVLETPPGEQLYQGTWTIDQADQVFIGKEHWTGPADCSATAELTVTTGGIDLVVTVVDDTIVLNASATSPHINDSVEFYCDVRPADERQREYYEPGVFQQIVRPGFGYRDELVTFNSGKSGGQVPVLGYETASERTDDGYMVRIVLPAEGLAQMHAPLSDGMRFSIGLNDADKGKRETQMRLAGDDNNWQWAKDWQPITFTRDAAGTD
ncbi:MAG: sugar-binding protein [Planctomycetota bacterium]